MLSTELPIKCKKVVDTLPVTGKMEPSITELDREKQMKREATFAKHIGQQRYLRTDPWPEIPFVTPDLPELPQVVVYAAIALGLFMGITWEWM